MTIDKYTVNLQLMVSSTYGMSKILLNLLSFCNHKKIARPGRVQQPDGRPLRLLRLVRLHQRQPPGPAALRYARGAADGRRFPDAPAGVSSVNTRVCRIWKSVYSLMTWKEKEGTAHIHFSTVNKCVSWAPGFRITGRNCGGGGEGSGGDLDDAPCTVMDDDFVIRSEQILLFLLSSFLFFV